MSAAARHERRSYLSMCRGKVAYASYSAAANQHKYMCRTSGPASIYRCRHCGHFHCGHDATKRARVVAYNRQQFKHLPMEITA